MITLKHYPPTCDEKPASQWPVLAFILLAFAFVSGLDYQDHLKLARHQAELACNGINTEVPNELR